MTSHVSSNLLRSATTAFKQPRLSCGRSRTSTGDYGTSFCRFSGWQKTTPNPYLITPTITIVPITTKMECHRWYHSCHQSKRLAAAYPASSPPNDCSLAARRRAVPRPTYPSLYQKVVRLIRRSILLQPPSQRRTISPPPQWEALKLLHHHRKQTYLHRHRQTPTQINTLSTNAPTATNNPRAAVLEPYIPTPKIHKVTHPRPLHSSPIETATAATLRLPQAASGTGVHLLSNTSNPNNSDNNSSSSSNSKCKMNPPLLVATTANHQLTSSNLSASAWKTPARRSSRRLSKNTKSTPTGGITLFTSSTEIKSGVWGCERNRSSCSSNWIRREGNRCSC